MNARMTYAPTGYGVEFEWHGGEYIQVGYTATEPTGPFNDKGQASYYPGEFVAQDVINVWDYAKGEPTIDVSLEAFEEACDAWLTRQEEEED